MGNEGNSFQTLDEILASMWMLSSFLGPGRKDIRIEIYIGPNGHNGRGLVESREKSQYEYQSLYHSKSHYEENYYNVRINNNIGGVKKNIKEIKKLIKDIERLAIQLATEVYKEKYKGNKGSYLDSEGNYSKILIDFEEKTSDFYKILEEMNENSIIFGWSTDKYVSQFVALRARKNKNSGEIELSYPKNYRFSFIAYYK
jgi:hypothetical protein